jgi:hypothetical protein
VNKHACFGESNPNSLLDAKTVREIRLLHLCDGISASQIARDHSINVSCISRIVRWHSWATQDDDLRVIERPIHRGGGDHSRTPKPMTDEPVAPTCRQCIHLTKAGRCGFEFPECIRSGFKEAAKCSAFVLIPTPAGAPSNV